MIEVILSIDNGAKKFDVTKILKCKIGKSFGDPVGTFEAEIQDSETQPLRGEIRIGSVIQVKVIFTDDTFGDSVSSVRFTGWIDTVDWDDSAAIKIKCRDSLSVVMDSRFPVDKKGIAPGTHIGTIFQDFVKPFGLGFQSDLAANVVNSLKVSSGFKKKVDAKGQTTQVFAPGKGAILLEQNDFKIEPDENVGSILQLIARRSPVTDENGNPQSLYIASAPDALACQLVFPNYGNSLSSAAEYLGRDAKKGTSPILSVDYTFDMKTQPSHFAFMGKLGGKEFKNSAHKVIALNPLFAKGKKSGASVSLSESTWSPEAQDRILKELNHKDLKSAPLLANPPRILSGNIKSHFQAGKYPARILVEKDDESRTIEALQAYAFRRRGNFLKEAFTATIVMRGWTYQNQAGDSVFWTHNHSLAWNDKIRGINTDLWVAGCDLEFAGNTFKTTLTCYLPYCL